MNRRGSGALILVLIAIVGAGYYFSQNPEAMQQVQDSIGADGFQLPGGGGACSGATQWARNNGYDPQRCVCSTSGTLPDIGDSRFAILELENGDYLGAIYAEKHGWSNPGTGPGSSTDAEAQKACDEMERAYQQN